MLLPLTAIAQSRQLLYSHVPAEIAGLVPKGQVPGTAQLHLAVGLPLRNREALGEMLAQVTDPANPNYRHYLSPRQFTDLFGPTESDYDRVAEFFRQNGLAVTARYSNRMILDVSGRATDVERVFHVTLRTYRHPTEARDFFAPDVEPSIDLSVPILHVAGLNDYHRPHPNFKPMEAAVAEPMFGSGTNKSYRGKDFRAAYLPSISTNELSGAGQTVAVLEFDGYYPNDIAAYENISGLPNIPLTNVAVNGGVSSITKVGSEEVSLDIEMIACMAPGVSQIMVYEAANPSPFSDLLNRIATDNAAQIVSCSWGAGGPDPVSEQIFQEMALQGQSFFNASGDSDAFVGKIPFPSDSTNIIQVGGTKLFTSKPGGVWTNEAVWNSGNGAGSSGGVSKVYSLPSWQQGVATTANKGSTTMRNVPDVAMCAQNIEVIYGNGRTGVIIGTSAAAPLWAGFAALVNQRAAEMGQAPVGFINPAIYAIGKSTNYDACFHDIKKGNNFWMKSRYKYKAVPGYDLCTGWGSPKTNLIGALMISGGLGITPAGGFIATGIPGGPFDVTSQTFTLTNAGSGSVDWLLGNLPAWLEASGTGGTLAGHAGLDVTVNLNAAASNLVAGVYTASIIFTNVTASVAQAREFIAEVGQNIVGNGGFESGDFGLWTFTGSSRQNFVGTSSKFVHSGTYGAQFGQVGSLATLSQSLSTFAGQGYLLSFWLVNPQAGGSSNPEKFTVAWDGTTLATLNNPPSFSWTNYQFTVTASTASTLLQFQFQNNPNFFGLDDVSVTPIQVPAVTAMTASGNSMTLNWNATAGVKYQVQYSTDLVHWQDIGNVVTATGRTAALTFGVGTEPQRFYRVRWLP
ncbi:MAG TPA: protease pro-enzyme activation domain-containing protein [Verrucomicrobiae bacterium]|nr:protease pro-enzyme activation domain-containing protein [Verrucomicrobiae bacterium]